MSKDKSYRIRTKIGNESEKVLYVNLEQTYDSLDILSLKINQTNAYKLYQADYGVVVGRVYANGGFGVPNAKISVFFESTEEWNSVMKSLYPYASVNSVDNNGIRYNLLMDEVDDACHQNVGTFPNKRFVLDNNDIIEVFDKYYKYTTATNSAGDYMLFGIPTGQQTIHMDVDLSDVGILSQRPRDMIYKGYNITMFESPNKFKTDTNLDSLPQIQSQDTSIFVYPYWGDTSDTTDSSDLIAVTRCDISLKYKFEPTCIFMGSVITSTGTDAINKDCSSSPTLGRMENLVTGEGTIEMIRKRFDNKVEQFSIEGNRLIDSDGVWCYQIPMNLDYIITDEFGNIVPSDNPDKGIPTRTRVRFRVSIDDIVNDEKARNRCKYLVPNNPHLDEVNYPYFTEQYKSSPETDDGVDYEFGTKTKDENFRDLFWNKVYTVKNYIPRIQKGTYGKNNRKYCGIKLINHHGDNNPMPFNNLSIKLGFTYKLLCFIIKLIINLISFLNNLITVIAIIPCILYKFFNGCSKIWLIGVICKPFRNAFKAAIPSCVSLDSEFCGDEVTHKYTYYPGCGKFLGANLGSWAGCVADITRERHNKKQVNGVEVEDRTTAVFGFGELMNCVENSLAEEHDALSLNFTNDWINGCLFMPMWFRRITPKKKFLFWTIHRAKDEYCNFNTLYGALYTLSTCALRRRHNVSYDSIYSTKGKETAHILNGGDSSLCGNKNRDCDKNKAYMRIPSGVVVSRTTIDEKTVYYYKAASTLYTTEEGKSMFGRLFATDIVLLGSLNECDIDGVPQFFKSLESTTYNEPSQLLVASTDIAVEYNEDFGDEEERTGLGYLTSHTEAENEGSIKENRGPRNINLTATTLSEQTGKDWGNTNDDLCNGGKTITAGDNAGNNDDGGLFYGIGCSNTDVRPKSCINLSRICEYGVMLDSSSLIETEIENGDGGVVIDGTDIQTERLSPDGYISKDDIYDDDGRTAFATMNGNGLKTVVDNTTGLRKYVFKTLIVDNFDGSLYDIMKKTQTSCTQSPKYNYYLETFSDGYYDFRMGTGINNWEGSSDKNTHFYDYENSFPIYENSFYFYFGLKPGKTAIEKFNSIYFSECADTEASEKVDFTVKARAWCTAIKEPKEPLEDKGYVTFDVSEVEIPCDISLSPMSNAVTEQITYKINQVQHEKIYVSQVKHPELEKKGYVKVELSVISSSEQSESMTYLPNGTYSMSVEDADGNFYDDILDVNPPSMKCTTIKTNFVNSSEELLEIYGTYANIIAESKLANAENTDNMTIDVTREIGGTIAMATPIDSLNDSNILDYTVTLELIGELNVETIGYSDNRKIKYWRQISKSDYEWLNVENEEVVSRVVGDKVYKISTRDEGDERVDVKLAVEGDNGEDNTYYAPITPEENDRIEAKQYTASVTVNNGKIVSGDIDKIMTSITNGNGTSGVGDAINAIVFKLPKDNEQYRLTVTELCKDDNGDYIQCGNVYTERFSVTVKQPFKLIINETIDYDVIKDWETGFIVSGTGKGRKIVEKDNSSISQKWLHISNPDNYSWNKLGEYQDLDEQIISMLLAIKSDINSLQDNEDALYEVYDVVLSYLYKTDNEVKTFVDNMFDNAGRYGQKDIEETVGFADTFLYNRKNGNINIEIDIEAAKRALDKINNALSSSRYQINSIISKEEYDALTATEKEKHRPITYYNVNNDSEIITFNDYEKLPTLTLSNYVMNKAVECLWTTENGSLTRDEQAEYHVYCYQTSSGEIFTEENTDKEKYITYYSNGHVTNNLDGVSDNPNPDTNDITKGSIKLPYSYLYKKDDLQMTWFDYISYRCQSDFKPYEYINVDTFKVTVFINQEWKDTNNNLTYSGYYLVLNEFINDNMINFKLLSDGSTRYHVTYINGETSLPVDWDTWYITADGKEPTNTIDEVVSIDNTIKALLDRVPLIKDSFIVDMKNAFMITCKGQNKMMTFSALTDDRPVEYNVVYRNEVLPEDVEDPEFNVLEPKDTIIDVNGSMIDNITIPTIINVNNKSYGNTLHKITESGDRLCFARDNYFKTPSSAATDKYWKKAYFIGLKNRVGDTIPRGERTDTSLKYFGFHIIGKPLDIQSISWANIKGIPYFNVTGNRAGNTVTMSGLLSGNIYNGIISSNKDENGKNMTFFEEQSVGAATLKIYTPIPDGFNENTIEDEIPTKRYIVGLYSLDRIVDLAKKYINELDLDIYFEKVYKTKIYVNNNDDSDIIDDYTYNIAVEEYNQSTQSGETLTDIDPTQYTEILNKYKMILSNDYAYLSEEEQAYYFGEFYYYYNEADIENSIQKWFINENDEKEYQEYIEIDSGYYVKYTEDHVVEPEKYTSYRNYKCIESYDSDQQYVTLLPLDSDMVINDKSDCYAERYIDANMKIVLSNGSVNDCRHKYSDESSIFDVDCDNMSAESVTYYAFMVSNNSSEGTPYPLNNAVPIGSIGGIEMPLSYIDVGATSDIDTCKFSYNKTKNNTKWLFTTATQPTIASNGRMYLGDVQTTSELQSTSGSGNNVTFTGYSDTGSFTLKTDKAKYASRTYSHRPYYIVAITSDNARAISPVYDFTYTEFVFEVGKLRELIDSTDDNGNPITETDVRYGFTLNVREDGDKHYYFQNYEYTIQVFKKSENQYTSLGNVYHYPDNMRKYGTLIENEYVKDMMTNGGNGRIALSLLFSTIEAQAKDITGLLHKNVLYDDTGFFDTNKTHYWETINWLPNGGTWTYGNSFTPRSYYGTDETVSLIYDNGETYYLAGGGQDVTSFEQIVENVNEYGVKFEFCGWTTSPDGQSVYGSPDTELTVNNPINYYASWGAADDAITVLWDYKYPNGTSYHTDTMIPKGRLTCVDLPPKPVYNGYSFDGWKNVANNDVVRDGCYKIDDTDNSVGDSVTLQGQWTQTSFFVNICLEVDGIWVNDGQNIALYDNGNMYLRFSCNGHNDDGYYNLHSSNGGTIVGGNKMYFKKIINPISNDNGQAGLNFKVHSLLFETKKFTNNANEVLYLYSIGRNGMSDTSTISTVNVNENIEKGEIYSFGGFPNTANNTIGNWTNTYNGITDDYCGIIEYGGIEEYKGDIYYKITLKNLYYNQ